MKIDEEMFSMILDLDDKTSKVMCLWMVAILDHRGKYGDRAWDELKGITDENIVTAMAFMSGLMIGGNCKTIHTLEDYLTDYLRSKKIN